jgi:hypothetical protein
LLAAGGHGAFGPGTRSIDYCNQTIAMAADAIDDPYPVRRKEASGYPAR